jgi:transposase
MVLRTAQRFKVHVLFNAEYSPQLNPIELLFTLLKREARRHVEEIETR